MWENSEEGIDWGWIKRNKAESYASPTADEMLDQLPKMIKDQYGQDQVLHIGLYNGWKDNQRFVRKEAWDVYYQNHFGNWIGEEQSLADAAARAWLYLKEKDLLVVK